MIVSIAIETTGSNPETCQILEIGAVCHNKSFHCYVNNDSIQGEPYALSRHSVILKRIATKERGFLYIHPDQVAKHFADFLGNQKVTAAGENFASFDKQFLNKLPNWKKYVQFDDRHIDVGNLYWQPDIDGDTLPDLKVCMKRADFSGGVPHNAFEDAQIVLRLAQEWRGRNDI